MKETKKLVSASEGAGVAKLDGDSVNKDMSKSEKSLASKKQQKQQKQQQQNANGPNTAFRAAIGTLKRRDIVSFESDGEDENVRISKKDYATKKKEQNKEWKSNLKSMRAATVDDEDVYKKEIPDLNPRHSLYFREQLPCLREDEEWTAFQNSLAAPLPGKSKIEGSLCVYCSYLVLTILISTLF